MCGIEIVKAAEVAPASENASVVTAVTVPFASGKRQISLSRQFASGGASNLNVGVLYG